MAYISLNNFKSGTGKLNPDWIILRSINYTKGGSPDYFLNIPRQVSTKAGIDFGTLVDIQFDPDKSMLRLQLTKEVNGFKVRAQKHTGKNSKNPPSRVIIQFPAYEQAKLPKIKKPIIITEYEINNGLIMRIPSSEKEK